MNKNRWHEDEDLEVGTKEDIRLIISQNKEYIHCENTLVISQLNLNFFCHEMEIIPFGKFPAEQMCISLLIQMQYGTNQMMDFLLMMRSESVNKNIQSEE